MRKICFLIFILFLLRFLPIVDSYAQNIITPNTLPGVTISSTKAILHLPFDENSGDKTKNLGTLKPNLVGNLGGSDNCPGESNCPNWNSNGESGAALDFDGINDVVDLGIKQELQFHYDHSFSFSSVFKVQNLPTAGHYPQIFIQSGPTNSSGHFQYAIHIDGDTGGKLCTSIGVSFVGGNSACTPDPILADTWYHVTGVYDQSFVYLYLDGEFITKTAYSMGAPSSPGGNFYIGSGGDNFFFEGTVDDVRVYDYALNENEIKHTVGTGNIVPNLITDTIDISLDTAPTDNVTINLGSSDGSLIFSPNSVTITPTNWQYTKVIIVSSTTVVNSLTEKNITFSLTSIDPNYNGLSVTPFPINVNVNSKPTVNITPITNNSSLKETLEISGTTSDLESNILSVEYRIESDPGPYIACLALDNNWDSNEESFKCNLSGLINGNHTIHIRSFDGSLYSNISSYTFTIDLKFKITDQLATEIYGVGLIQGIDGFPRYLYQDFNTWPAKIFHARCTDLDCTSPVITEVISSVESEYRPGSYMAVLGYDGLVNFTYMDSNYKLIYVRCLDQDCITKSSTTIDENLDGNFPGYQNQSIIIGNDHLPRILYTNIYGNNDIHFVRFTAIDTPGINTNLTNSNIFSVNNFNQKSMVIGSDNFIRIVYFDSEDNNKLKLARCTNDVCTSTVITTLDQTNSWPYNIGLTIRMGSDNLLRISYSAYDDNNGANFHNYFIVCNDQDCSNPNVQSLPMRYQSDSDNGAGMALNILNLATLSFTSTEDNSIHTINCTNNTCSTYIDYNLGFDAPAMGGFSIQMFKDNLPRILYTGSSSNSLYFIRYLDMAPPIIIANNINATTYSKNLEVSGSISDILGTIKSVDYQLDSKTGTWTSCISNDNVFDEMSETFRCNLTNITDGIHKIYLRGTDSSNNVTASSSYTEISFTKLGLSKVVITSIGLILNIPNRDTLKYRFTSQTPKIKGNSDANSTVYFVVNNNIYSSVTNTEGKFEITLKNPSLLREKNTIKYYTKDNFENKSNERTLELTIGFEDFPIEYISSSSSTTSSSESSLSNQSNSPSSSSTSSSNSEMNEFELTILDNNGKPLVNSKIIVNGNSYFTDSNGKVKVRSEVKGEYIVEFEKEGIKYTDKVGKEDTKANLKVVNSSGYISPIIVILLTLLVLSLLIFFIVIIKRKKGN